MSVSQVDVVPVVPLVPDGVDVLVVVGPVVVGRRGPVVAVLDGALVPLAAVARGGRDAVAGPGPRRLPDRRLGPGHAATGTAGGTVADQGLAGGAEVWKIGENKSFVFKTTIPRILNKLWTKSGSGFLP